MSDLIFVYGALRKTASHEARMKDAEFVSHAEVEGKLLKIDWYPGLVLGPGTRVKGEVYRVSPELLAELDSFEGIDSATGESSGEYHRIKRVILVNDEPQEVWIYEWLKGTKGYLAIKSGDWLAQD